MAKLSNDNIAKYRPQTRNGNKHTQRGMGMLESSMRQYGYVSPMTAAADGEIIDGSARIETSANVFGDDAIVVHHDGTKPVIMVRDDIPSADTPEARAISMAANRISQVNLDFDAEVILGDLQAGVDLSQFWRKDELDELLADLQPKTTGDTPAEVDRAEELRQKWNVSAGQLWALGEHKLICGDCTDPATVARVMGGEKAALMLTDPPYKGAMGDGAFPGDAGLRQRTEKLKASIEHIYDFDPGDFLKTCLREFCTDKAAFLFWCNKVQLPIYMRFAVDGVFGWYLLTWHKPNFIPLNHGKYYPDTEYLFKISDKGATFNTGIPKEQASYNTYWIEEMGSGSGGHPTEKPLRPHLDQIQICTNAGDIVADPFSGSGTTIIACENLGRKCRAVEISPAYVAVALERWSVHTSRQPVLVDI